MNDCRLCGSLNSLIKDYNTNFTKCKICGTTIKENEIDEILDFSKYINQNDKIMEYINDIVKEPLIQNNSSTKRENKKKDQNLIETKINNKIEDFSKKMELSFEIKTKVKEYTKKIFEKKKLKLKVLDSIIASVIFIVCRNENEPKTMQEISSQLELNRRTVNRCYNSIKDMITENKNQTPETVKKLINSYCDKILENENEKLKKLSCEISDNVCNYELIEGRNPTTIAAACILIAVKLLKLNIGKKDISKKIGTTENTISNACLILKDYFQNIVPKEFKNDIHFLLENLS